MLLVRRLLGVSALILAGWLPSSAHAAPFRLDQLAPNTPQAKANHLVPAVKPKVVLPDNVRAVAVMYAVSRSQRAGLFKAGDRIVADFTAKKLKLSGPAAAAVADLARDHAELAKGPSIASQIGYVSELIHAQFQALVKESIAQMEAYEELVGSVANSVDQFTNANVSADHERDFLHSKTLALSNAGYGAAHFSAARLSKHAHELTHVVQQRELQKAYGAKNADELVAKLGGSSAAEVRRELSRGRLGAELLVWLAKYGHDAKQLRARAKKDGISAVITKLRKLSTYRSHTPRKHAKLPTPKPRCVRPGKKQLVPCWK